MNTIAVIFTSLTCRNVYNNLLIFRKAHANATTWLLRSCCITAIVNHLFYDTLPHFVMYFYFTFYSQKVDSKVRFSLSPFVSCEPLPKCLSNTNSIFR
jgi:hypothetical protein